MEATTHSNISEMAVRISEWADARRMSIKRLCRDFPALGSDRTFRDMRDGRLEGYDIARFEAAYATVCEVIIDPATTREPLFDELRPVVELRAAVAEVMKSWGINRVVILQGEPGDGKSTAAQILAAKLGERVCTLEAADAWNDKPGAFLGALLRTLGEGAIPASASERLVRCQKALCEWRRCLIVDEAHHCGPRILNTIKTLINTTPGEVILLAIPTLWQKLERSSYQEARQISTNRLRERVQLGLDEGAVVEYLRLSLPHAGRAETRKAARELLKQAKRHGNYSYLRDVAQEAREIAPDGTTITAEMLLEAARTVTGQR